MAFLKDKYDKEVIAALTKELGLSNPFEVPKLEKIVINVGLGDGGSNAKLLDAGLEEISRITGQKPLVTRSKKAIAGFKLRENVPVGAKVTLRGARMYEFMAKLINVVLPRIRDFQGMNPRGFDGRGNFNIGLKDQLVFPEIEYDKVQRLRGMNITIVTTATNDVAAKALLGHLGMPFRKTKAQQQEAKEAKAS